MMSKMVKDIVESVSGNCIWFFKQKTAYEMRISDWSSDVCSSDLPEVLCAKPAEPKPPAPVPAPRLLPASAPLRLPAAARLRPVPSSARSSSCPDRPFQIGSASCRERVCQYVYILVVSVSLKIQIHNSSLYIFKFFLQLPYY